MTTIGTMPLQQALQSYIYRTFDVTGAVVQFPHVTAPEDWHVYWPDSSHPERDTIMAAVRAFIAGWEAGGPFYSAVTPG